MFQGQYAFFMVTAKFCLVAIDRQVLSSPSYTEQTFCLKHTRVLSSESHSLYYDADMFCFKPRAFNCRLSDNRVWS